MIECPQLLADGEVPGLRTPDPRLHARKRKHRPQIWTLNVRHHNLISNLTADFPSRNNHHHTHSIMQSF